MVGAGWPKSGRGGHLSAGDGSLDRGIWEIASRQHQLINRSQLLELGLGPSGIHKRILRGRLFRVHHGVYSLTPPPHPKHQRWLAAVLACGPGSLLSDISSAELCGYADITSLVSHVAAPRGSGRGREGVAVHRHVIDARDIRRVDGIPCVSADRTLIDLAPQRTEAELEILLVAAESLRILKRGRLAELIDERHGRPGIHRLASLIALQPAIVRSDLELQFLPVWRRAGVERPLVNHPIQVEGRTLVVDFAWPEHRVVIELDSQRFHGDWESAVRDRERDQLLALAVWRPHRFTRDQLLAGPAERVARLLAVARLG